MLDPIDNGIVEEQRLVPEGYLTLMRENLERLYAALVLHNAGTAP